MLGVLRSPLKEAPVTALKERRTSRAVALIAVSAAAATAMLAFSAGPAAATPRDHKMTICHATGSDKNPYVEITVDTSSINNLVDGNGHGRHADDIIPAFTDSAGHYFAGVNTDLQWILDQGCCNEVPQG
jgi:hypothetical protein